MQVEAQGDDGTLHVTTLTDDGTFDLEVPPEGTWSLRIVGAAVWPVALARQGHFDRALITQGRATGRLGTLWVPSSAEVTRVLLANEATCVEGRLTDGGACAVLEALVSCADGPQRPLDDPPSLLLGTGTLAELPGTSAGVRYAVSARVPPPILWECGELPLP